jgi:hypothetical protein
MGEDQSTSASYIEFSIHHLEQAGHLPAGSDLEQFQAHPLHAKLAEGWLAEDIDDEGAADLLQLEERLFKSWDESRQAWVVEHVSTLGLSADVCADAVRLIARADERLAAGIAKVRGRDRAMAAKLEAAREEAAKATAAELAAKKAEMARAISQAESIPWPNPEHARELASLLGEMAEEGAPLPFEQARDYARISRRDAETAAEVLERLAEVTTLQLAALEEMRQKELPDAPPPAAPPRTPTLSKAWQKLWDNPSGQAMSILNNLVIDICKLIGPHMLTDDELAASPQYQELIVRIDVPVGSSPERYREKTLATLREKRAEELPISAQAHSEVAKVLSRYFENWRISLTAPDVARILDPDLEEAPRAY